MTQRERLTPDGGTPATIRHAPLRCTQPPLTPPLAGLPSVWVDWFERASPEQRQQALARAAEQGVVVAQQLPPVAPKPATPPTRTALPALLSGPVLEPVRSPEVEVSDRDLDPLQRQAVARAVNTLDVALIQGLPGTGKSRVVAEILRQLSTQGRRVLFVAPHGSALDRVFELVCTWPAARPLRCLAAEESLASLSPWARSLTAAEVLRSVQEEALPAARQKVQAAQERYQASQADAAHWNTFAELLATFDELARQSSEAEQLRASLPEAIESELAATGSAGEPTPLQQRWLESQRQRDEALARLDQRQRECHAGLERLTSERQQLESERGQLEPLAEAKKASRWWSSAYWRATLQGGKLLRLDEIQQRLTQLGREQQKLEQELAATQGERDEAAARCQEGRRQLAEAELHGRQAALEARKAGMDEERSQAGRRWQEAVAALSTGTVGPNDRSTEAVQRARQSWVAQLEGARQEVERAQQWVQALEQSLPSLPDQLAGWANVVAATPAALAQHPHLTEAGFDLLLVEEAHLVPETDFVALTKLAPRLVAVGEPSLNGEEAGTPRRAGAHGGRGPRSVVVRAGYFQQLWHRLHADPGSLPSRWSEQDGQRICRLRPVSEAQEPWVESERVADRPEIELRIVAPPHKDPDIAEVVFPLELPVNEAKEFLYHELEEITVQPTGHALRWHETAERITLELSPGADGVARVGATLDDGLREVVALQPLSNGGIACPTLALEFERSAQWDRDRAEGWVEEHLHLRDRGRTTFLSTPHRPLPSLARCLGEVLFPGSNWFRLSASAASAVGSLGCVAELGSTPVQFLPVPAAGAPLTGSALHRGDGRRGGDLEGHPNGSGTATAAPRMRQPVRGGAGFEVDLADNRRTEQLPGDLRSALPRNGLVNYPEARVVVQTLESFVRDPALQSAWSAWQKNPASGPRPLAIAVMALFPAQVELIRLLIQRSSLLESAPGLFEVGLPADFQQRECLVAFLSLTRSHTHRAVPFSDHPRSFVLALTRAVSRILVFGDPGTLSRRTQWNGALDHLDEVAGRREQTLMGHFIGHLVDGVPEKATPPLAPRLTESSRV